MSHTLHPLRKQRLQRSELAVPASNPTMIDKASTSSADFVFLDLEDAVAPPFEWTAPPPGTQEIVLIAEDADNAASQPFCHWLVWGMPGQRGHLLEGEVPPRVGKNAHGNSEWLLPEVAHGDPEHQFVFQLFALELPMTIMPGATREDVIASMKGQVIACALTTATYAGSEDEGEGGWDEEF